MSPHWEFFIPPSPLSYCLSLCFPTDFPDMTHIPQTHSSWLPQSSLSPSSCARSRPSGLVEPSGPPSAYSPTSDSETLWFSQYSILLPLSRVRHVTHSVVSALLPSGQPSSLCCHLFQHQGDVQNPSTGHIHPSAPYLSRSAIFKKVGSPLGFSMT